MPSQPELVVDQDQWAKLCDPGFVRAQFQDDNTCLVLEADGDPNATAPTGAPFRFGGSSGDRIYVGAVSTSVWVKSEHRESVIRYSWEAA